jgi:hypothetical protein
MKSKGKDQEKHQEELEKTSEKIDSVGEHAIFKPCYSRKVKRYSK